MARQRAPTEEGVPQLWYTWWKTQAEEEERREERRGDTTEEETSDEEQQVVQTPRGTQSGQQTGHAEEQRSARGTEQRQRSGEERRTAQHEACSMQEDVGRNSQGGARTEKSRTPQRGGGRGVEGEGGSGRSPTQGTGAQQEARASQAASASGSSECAGAHMVEVVARNDCSQTGSSQESTWGRRRTAVRTYDEVERRGPHPPRARRHVERGRGPRAVTVVAITTTVVSRIVAQQYMWQVANHRRDIGPATKRGVPKWPLIWDDGG